MVIGKSNKHQGGILLSAVMMVGLVSLLFLTVIENTKLTTDFSVKTLHFYQAKIMSELFWQDYQKTEMLSKGEAVYNTGKIFYEEKDGQLEMNCQIQNRFFTITMPLKAMTNSSG